MTKANDEKAIRRLLETFIEGWNAADGDLLAQPADDADFSAVTGQRVKGREVIARGHNDILATVFRGTHNSAEVNDVTFLRPDVALVDVTFRIAPMTDKPWLPPYTTCGIVATREQGRWWIRALRNMIPASRPAGGALDQATLGESRAALETARG